MLTVRNVMFPNLDYPLALQGHRSRFLSINKFLPLSIVYFFLNSVALPHGLQYTTILAPLFYMWLLLKGEKFIVLKYIICFSPFVVMQALNGFNIYYYVRSYVLLMFIYITVYACAIMLRRIHAPERVFDQVIVINFILACLALLILNTPYLEPVWAIDKITTGSESIARLRLLTYEPSYYAMLMVPFFVFALFRVTRSPRKKHFLSLLLILVPMLMAFSFGVIAALFIAISIVSLWKVKELLRKPVMVVFITLVSGVGVVFLQSSSSEILTHRVHNILSGEDSSGNTRTVEANLFAYQLASSTSLWWGAGFGQTKLILDDYVIGSADRFSHLFRITNVVASTFATFGIMGLLFRFCLEIYLFFKTRVYTSDFRMSLFLFMFVYQFTGSYLTNIAEYIIWIFTFFPIFQLLERIPVRNRLWGGHRKHYRSATNSGVVNP